VETEVASAYQRRRVLIAVKTYPTPARHGVEVSCTAGIAEDGTWVRLFPVPFRFLEQSRQFAKYQWVEVGMTKSSDPRPESYRVDLSSIKLLDSLPTSNKWERRKAVVLPHAAPSLCHLMRARRDDGPTLGVFKPRQITRLLIRPEDPPDWTQQELEILSQQSMFDRKPWKPLEKIPYRFLYSFVCDDPNCKGHTLSVTDWEAGQAYRSWRRHYGADWERAFRQKFEREMIHGKETYFFVGTMRVHPDRWIIIGLFYPPR
jgi:hypothetical protein